MLATAIRIGYAALCLAVVRTTVVDATVVVASTMRHCMLQSSDGIFVYLWNDGSSLSCETSNKDDHHYSEAHIPPHAACFANSQIYLARVKEERVGQSSKFYFFWDAGGSQAAVASFDGRKQAGYKLLVGAPESSLQRSFAKNLVSSAFDFNAQGPTYERCNEAATEVEWHRQQAASNTLLCLGGACIVLEA